MHERSRQRVAGALNDEWHPAVQENPESIWERIHEYMCQPAKTTDAESGEAQEQHLTRVDLIEDLMFWHSDAFIDRIEALGDECPGTREAIVDAYVGGRAPTNGLDRFWALQERLRPDVEGQNHAP
jgi:hypothetical protein